jgi:hypothetical protein
MDHALANNFCSRKEHFWQCFDGKWNHFLGWIKQSKPSNFATRLWKRFWSSFLEFPTSFNVTVRVWHRMDFLGHGTIQGCFSHYGNQQIILSKIWFASISRIKVLFGTLPLPSFCGCHWPYVHWLIEWGTRAYSLAWQPSNVTNVCGWHYLVSWLATKTTWTK